MRDDKDKNLTKDIAEDLRQIKASDKEKREKLDKVSQIALFLAERFEKLEIFEYFQMKMHPVKLLFLNFFVGLARGFGIALGMTVVVALAAYMLSHLISIPIIGKYVAQIVEIVDQYMKQGIR